VNIRLARAGDAPSIAGIYNHYVRNSVITFEEADVSDSDMAARISTVLSAGMPWLVAVEGDDIRGFAYAGEWKGRCAYRYSVEITVYLAHDAVGGGLGSRLYRELFSRLEDSPVHVAVAAIALPNPQSVSLHEKFGMQKVAHFPEVGFKFGRWIDVGYWQVILGGGGEGPGSG